MLVLLKPWELFIICLVNNIPSQYVPFQFPSQVHVALPFTSTLHVPLFSQGLLTHGETGKRKHFSSENHIPFSTSTNISCKVSTFVTQNYFCDWVFVRPLMIETYPFLHYKGHMKICEPLSLSLKCEKINK
jgi:hypothetical protein